MVRLFFLRLTLTLSLFGAVSAWAQSPYLSAVPDHIIRGQEPELVGKIIITIDDCAVLSDAEAMFETLNARDLKATFFCNTMYLSQQDPTFWRHVLAAGWEFGYHTQQHTMPSETNYQGLVEDYAGYLAFMREYLAAPDLQIRFIRPPFGDWSPDWLQWGADHDLYTTRWNNVPSGETTFEYVRAVISHPQGGPIILLHTRPFDRDWLENNIDDLAAMVSPVNNSTFPTLSEAFLTTPVFTGWN